MFEGESFCNFYGKFSEMINSSFAFGEVYLVKKKYAKDSTIAFGKDS